MRLELIFSEYFVPKMIEEMKIPICFGMGYRRYNVAKSYTLIDALNNAYKYTRETAGHTNFGGKVIG